MRMKAQLNLAIGLIGGHREELIRRVWVRWKYKVTLSKCG
jgi:hypothetical protein